MIMLFKIFYAINLLILQAKTELTAEEVNQYKMQAEQLELSRLTTILSIALITILTLLTFSLWKIQKLKNENKRLRNNQTS